MYEYLAYTVAYSDTHVCLYVQSIKTYRIDFWLLQLYIMLHHSCIIEKLQQRWVINDFYANELSTYRHCT